MNWLNSRSGVVTKGAVKSSRGTRRNDVAAPEQPCGDIGPQAENALNQGHKAEVRGELLRSWPPKSRRCRARTCRARRTTRCPTTIMLRSGKAVASSTDSPDNFPRRAADAGTPPTRATPPQRPVRGVEEVASRPCDLRRETDSAIWAFMHMRSRWRVMTNAAPTLEGLGSFPFRHHERAPDQRTRADGEQVSRLERRNRCTERSR